MKKTVILLTVISVIIYGVQIAIFHDQSTTLFYLLQDLAFMPVTIAIATLVVGELQKDKEKKERLEKTQMLTSSFYTELGAQLLMEMNHIATYSEHVLQDMLHQGLDEKGISVLQDEIRHTDIKITLDADSYEKIRKEILEKQTTLLVISSNPLLLEHEDFTQMLWGIFHLLDEFRLRGEYDQLSEEDIHHFEDDFAKVFKLILISWVANVVYIQKHYPNFYNTSIIRIIDKQVK